MNRARQTSEFRGLSVEPCKPEDQCLGHVEFPREWEARLK